MWGYNHVKFYVDWSSLSIQYHQPKIFEKKIYFPLRNISNLILNDTEIKTFRRAGWSLTSVVINSESVDSHVLSQFSAGLPKHISLTHSSLGKTSILFNKDVLT